MADEDFVPYHEANPDDVSRLEAVPQDERGGFRVLIDPDCRDMDAFEPVLRADDRVLLVRFEEGRWYSNGEDGPPWYQYHVACRRADEGAIVEAFGDRVAKQLGSKAVLDYSIGDKI